MKPTTQIVFERIERFIEANDYMPREVPVTMAEYLLLLKEMKLPRGYATEYNRKYHPITLRARDKDFFILVNEEISGRFAESKVIIQP